MEFERVVCNDIIFLMDPNQRPDKLDKVEQQLYSPKNQIDRKPRKKFGQKQYEVDRDWPQERSSIPEENPFKVQNQKGLSIFTKILIVAFTFFFAAAGYALYVFNFSGGPEARNVDISINAPISVAAGEQFSFDVVVENNNLIDMQTVDLVITYPEGTRDGDDITVDLPRSREDLGGIETGTVLRSPQIVYLFGEEGDKKEIEVKIVYRVANSNAVFEKRKVFDVILKSTPVRANISSIKEVTVGQDLEFDIEIISNSNETLDNVLVKAEYPFGFIFDSSNSDSQISNDTWLFNKLDPKETIKFKVKGGLQGQNNDDKFFRFNIGLRDLQTEDEIGVLFTTVGKTVIVQRPFLEIDLSVNGQSSNIINLDSSTTYDMKVNYKNNTSLPIRDAVITLTFDGDVLDESSIQVTNGHYQSNNNTIIWDKSTISEFAQLEVGESGVLSFIFKSRSLVSGEIFKNPEIAIRAVVKGERFLEDDVPEEIENEVLKKLRFNSVILVDGNSLYYDGPFSNSGSIPPKVDQETTYTISFALQNSSNRISNSVLEMTLPVYVSWEGQTWPSDENIKYDSSNKKVVWEIGDIKESSGLEGTRREIAFQVSIAPSITQRGQTPVLVDNVNFFGEDLFTGEQIRNTLSRITTDIADQRNYFDGQVSQ